MGNEQMEPALEAAKLLKDWMVKAVANENGIHAESVLAAAGRMTGTQIIRSFASQLPPAPPGTAMFSDKANELGPPSMNLMLTTVEQLGNKVDQERLMSIQRDGKFTTALAHHSLIETQEKIDPFYQALARTMGFSHIEGSRAFAIATGLLVHDCRKILDFHEACAIAIHGIVEGAKTVPRPIPEIETPAKDNGSSAPPNKPWYKRW